METEIYMGINLATEVRAITVIKNNNTIRIITQSTSKPLARKFEFCKSYRSQESSANLCYFKIMYSEIYKYSATFI